MAEGSYGFFVSSAVSTPLVIVPEGELDLATLASLRHRIISAVSEGSGVAVLDLSQVSFIDSSSLGAVLEGDRLARRGGGRLAIVAPRGTAASSLFTLTGLRRRLAVFETVASAAAALVERPAG